jgi:aspartate kinase
VRIHCRSAFEDAPGTVVLSETETVEQPLITAVTHSTAEARVTLLGIPDEPGAAGNIFTALADANVNVDMIVQTEPVSSGGGAEISFTVLRADLRTARAALESLAGEAFTELVAHEDMGKVSIIGAGMRSHPGVAAKFFRVLAAEDINIDMISTSPIKISCVIERDHVERAVQLLHIAFELSGAGTVVEEQPFSSA